MSTFGALNTAYRGLTAAQQGMNVAGQNIANAATEGYTRQRVEQSAMAAPAQGLLGTGGPKPAKASPWTASHGWATASSTPASAPREPRPATPASGPRRCRASKVSCRNPGDNGISASLQNFWSAWQGAANQPGESGPAGSAAAGRNELTAKISSGYQALTPSGAASAARPQADVDTVNAAAAQVASLNTTIRSTIAAGGSANELIDARAKLTESITRLTGGTVREQPDGTVDVHVGGNALVMGSFRPDPGTLRDVRGHPQSPVQLEWTDTETAAGPDGGEIAGALSVLAPAAPVAPERAAPSPRRPRGTTPSPGRSGTPSTRCTLAPRRPQAPPPATSSAHPPRESRRPSPSASFRRALGTSASAPAPGHWTAASPTRFPSSAPAPGSPDSVWSGDRHQHRRAVPRRPATARRSAATSEASALTNRASQTSVSLDEENVSLLTNQHAYQAAARVMTAVDEALDVLINHTGLVGR